MTDPFGHLAGLTRAATDFVCGLEFADLDAETLRIARRCVLDGLAVALGGSAQPGLRPLLTYIERLGGPGEAPILGDSRRRVPAHLAALWFGTAGHAMDWDDTNRRRAGRRMAFYASDHANITAALWLAGSWRPSSMAPVNGEAFDRLLRGASR